MLLLGFVYIIYSYSRTFVSPPLSVAMFIKALPMFGRLSVVRVPICHPIRVIGAYHLPVYFEPTMQGVLPARILTCIYCHTIPTLATKV